MKLIICYTPLHVLIVEKLIALGFIKKYYLLYLCFTNNSKHRHYYHRLMKGSKGSSYIVLKHAILNDSYKLIKWIKELNQAYEFDAIFVGNQKHFYSRIIAWYLSITKFYTFDDGSGNISGDGYLYEYRENNISTMFFNIISPKYLYKNCAGNVLTHYTIYDEENVYDKFGVPKIKIDLFDENKTTEGRSENKKDELSVYLGNAFGFDSELTQFEEDQLDKMIVEFFGVNLYLPHPRRTDLKGIEENCNVRVEFNEKISEDIILHQLKEYKRIRVIGCYSSTLLNLAAMKGICLVNIEVKLNKPTAGLQSIFNKLNIKTVKLSELES